MAGFFEGIRLVLVVIFAFGVMIKEQHALKSFSKLRCSCSKFIVKEGKSSKMEIKGVSSAPIFGFKREFDFIIALETLGPES